MKWIVLALTLLLAGFLLVTQTDFLDSLRGTPGTGPGETNTGVKTTEAVSHAPSGNTQSPASAPLLPPVLDVDLGDGVIMQFVLLPPGEFRMGSPGGNEKPLHMVMISNPFYIGKHEVTQAQWEKLMGNNPSRFRGPNLPVSNVTWFDCQDFIARLKERWDGSLGLKRVSLPTEAQWEYACRAGTMTEYVHGDKASGLEAYAWYAQNSGGTPHPVGTRRPNDWGIYDMNGNVWEWCQDVFEGYPTERVTDPAGPKSGADRVLRGGSWNCKADVCRSAYRANLGPTMRLVFNGFRVVIAP